MFLKALTILAAVGIVLAQRPNDTTICDYYTPAVLKEENTPASQQKLMTLIVHTFIVGNYTTPNLGVKVAGIAAPNEFEGHAVNLLPYFTGGYASTNLGGSHGGVKNFLNDGGAVPLLMSKPANSTNSNQYTLLTHIYQYFGTFLGCSKQGGEGFPSYQGRPSMYTVHEFMDLDKYEMGFFNEQVALALRSIGFFEDDITFVHSSLETVFTRRCSPAATVIPASAGPNLQSICIAKNCLLDPNATCSAYPNNGIAELPAIANATLVGNVTKSDSDGTSNASSSVSGSSTSSTSGSSSASATQTTSTGGAVKLVGASTVIGSIAAVVGAGFFSFPL